MDGEDKLLQLLHSSYPRVPLTFIKDCIANFDADSCFQLVADRSAQAMLEMIAAGGVQSDEINPTQNSPLATPNRLRSVSFPTDPDCFNLPSGTQSSSPTTPGGSNIYAWRSTGAPANLPYANIPRTIGGGSYVIRNSPATYAQSPTAQTTVESGRVQQQQPTAARVGVKKHANLHLIVQGSNDSDADGQFSPSVYISNGSLGTPNIRLTPSSPSVTFVNAQRVSGGTSRSSSSSRSPYDAPEVSRAVPNSPWLHRRPDLLADFPSSSATTSSSVDSSPTSPLNRLPFGRPMGFNSGSSPSLNIDESSNERPNSVNSRGPIRLQTSSSCIFNHSDQLNGLTVITGRSRTQQSPLSVVLSPANDRRMSYPDLIASPVRTVERSPFATQPNQEVTNIRKYSQPLSIHVESDSSTPPARPVADRSFKGFSISLGMPNRTTSPLATTSPQSGQQLHQPLMKPTQLSFQPGSVQQMNPTAFSFQNSNFSHDNDQPMAPSDDYIRSYVAKQKERIQKLQNEFNYAKERQRELQSDVFLMENDLLSRRKHSLSQEKLSAQDISQLHADTRRLQAEIHTIMQELGADRAQKGNRGKTLRTTTGSASKQLKKTETSEPHTAYSRSGRMAQFLKTLSCDGQASVSDTLLKRLSRGKETGNSKFYTPADDTVVESEAKLVELNSNEVGSEQQWACDACTFHNDSAMPFCEVCQMPRLKGNTSVLDQSETNQKCYCHYCR